MNSRLYFMVATSVIRSTSIGVRCNWESSTQSGENGAKPDGPAMPPLWAWSPCSQSFESRESLRISSAPHPNESVGQLLLLGGAQVEWMCELRSSAIQAPLQLQLVQFAYFL